MMLLKAPLAWLVVRIFGLILLGAGLLDLYRASLTLAGGDLPPLRQILEAAGLAALAYYFLRHGKAVHRLLLHEEGR